MNAIDILGYFGTLMMFACFVPQLRKTFKSGNADGVELGYCLMGTVGMTSLLIFTLLSSRSVPLLINYAYSAIAFGIVLKYKLQPRTHGGTGRRG